MVLYYSMVVTTTSCSDKYANFYGKLGLLLVPIFVKSSIDVHQIVRKRESVLKNSSLLKRFWFSDVSRL